MSKTLNSSAESQAVDTYPTYSERRRVPIIGLDKEYEIDRRGRLYTLRNYVSGDAAYVNLTPNERFTYKVAFTDRHSSISVNQLLDKAFPEETDSTMRVLKHPRDGTWHVFHRAGDYGKPHAWRYHKHEGVTMQGRDELPPALQGVAARNGWAHEFPDALKEPKVIDGGEYLKRKQTKSSTEEAVDPITGAVGYEREENEERHSTNPPLVVAGESEVPLESEVPFDHTLKPFEFENPKTPEGVAADPLVNLAEAAARLALSIEMLIKNRRGE